MNVNASKLPAVLIFEPRVFRDARGYFMESFNENRYRDAGVKEKFVQDNISASNGPVMRGLHYQLKNPQGKLVSVLRGKVLDVVVDIRRGSPQFGQWIAEELSAENNKQIYVPPGFAHGFCVLSDEVIFHYKCTDYYNPQDEYGILWSDADLNIAWPQSTNFTLSGKDSQLPLLKDIPPAELPSFSA